MMTAPDITTIRNVALISHGGGGKTTLAETLLFNAKAIEKRGSVERGEAVMMTEPEEIERKITLMPHVGHFDWQSCHVNVIDTPGFINFLEASRGALSVVGGAVILFAGDAGVKAETERLWKMIKELDIPCLGFVNKMDMPRADFIRCMGEVESNLGVVALPVSIPIGQGEEFEGIVDLIPQTAWSAKDGVFTQIPMPDVVKADLAHYRTQLIEKIVETDDDMLMMYLEEGVEPDEASLHKGLKELVITGQLVPMFCGAAAKNIGVRALMNGIERYLCSPVDRASLKPLVGVTDPDGGQEVARNPSAKDPMSAVIFKTNIDPFAGRLSLVRVLSGVLKGDDTVYNATRKVREKAGHVFRLQGKEMEQVEALYAGEIGALAKLNHSQTGDTLADEAHPIHYPPVKYQEPGLSYAVEVDGKQEEKVALGLAKLAEEDPTIRLYRDEQTRELILAGMGQTHLQVSLERLKRKFGGVVSLKTPKVPYRETVRGRARVQGKLKKQTGGSGQYGDCWIEMEPLPRGGGFEFVDAIVGGVIPRQFIPSVEKGILESMAKGVIAGFPAVDIKVTLLEGTYHSVDSSDYAFKVAGSLAFKRGMEEADAVLLEPIMSMEVVVPDECLGDVIGDLNSRRGKITGMDPVGGSQKISAEVPMAEVLEYGNVLNALTAGRGLYTMTVSTYEEVPSHIARRVLEERKREMEE